MIYARRVFGSYILNPIRLSKYFMYTINISEELNFNPKFNPEEQEKILNVINNSNFEQLKRFNLPKGRIKNLTIYKEKKGPFKNLSEILEVEGLGVKLLEKFCKSIILEEKQSNLNNVKSSESNSKKRNLLTPPLDQDMLMKINSAVGLHLEYSGISWAKLACTNNKLEYWNYNSFISLPNKMTPIEIFQLATDIIKQLPVADLYVIESHYSMNPQQQKQTVAVALNQQIILTTMLLALINTSILHNPDTAIDSSSNIVYFLRSKVPARLFKTLLGNEKISSNSVISDLLNSSISKNALPCTAITTDLHLKEWYFHQSAANQDLLGQSLLLVMAFMNLCVYKNPKSLKALTLSVKR